MKSLVETGDWAALPLLLAELERVKPVCSDQHPEASHSPDKLHRLLSQWNKVRLEPAFPTREWESVLERDTRLAIMEGHFLEAERDSIRQRAAAAPEAAHAFMDWFSDLRASGPGQGDALFSWLASTADMEQMRWFLAQEVVGEAGVLGEHRSAQVRADDRTHHDALLT